MGAEAGVTIEDPSFAEAWARLEGVVQKVSQDGKASSRCVAVLGAPGSGKTELLRNAVRWIEGQGGVGVYFASPCAYQSSMVLSNLCHELAEKTEKRTTKNVSAPSGMLPQVLSRRSMQLGIAATALGTAAFILLRTPLDGKQLTGLLLLILALTCALVATAWEVRQRQLSNDQLRRLYLDAVAIKSWIRYSSTKKSASEWALEAGEGIGIVAKGRASQELDLSERPVTELDLVTAFKSFVRKLHEEGIGVLIAIDGLDKVDSVNDVRKLLRRIKAVFDTEAIVLVAIGDEAVIRLGPRDEIRGSFAETHEIRPLGRNQVRQLSENKLRDPSCSDTLWVLTGGNPREYWDLYEACPSPDRTNLTPVDWIDKATELERNNFENALVLDPKVDQGQRSSAFAWARDHLFSNARTTREKSKSLRAGWTPEWVDGHPWPSMVAEHWRRLLVRDLLRCVLRELLTDRQCINDASLESLNLSFYRSRYSAGIGLQTATVEDSELRGILRGLSTMVATSAKPSAMSSPGVEATPALRESPAPRDPRIAS